MTPLAFIPPPPTDGFHIGPLFLHLYGLCIAVGVLAAFWLANRRWVQAGGNPGELERPAIWAVAAGFLGGRIGYVATHTGDFSGNWLEVLFIWKGGLALYGGLTLGILTGLWAARRSRLPVLRALDAAIPAIPLAQAFGRWGNYFNQELFGTPTTLPWALEVERDFRPLQYREFETFHPTFLYESLYNLAVVAILIRVGARWRLRPGSLALVYLVLYGAGRFLLELLRTDTTYRLLGLSRNAYVSLALVVGGSVWLALRERRRPSAAAPEPAAPEAAGPEHVEPAEEDDRAATEQAKDAQTREEAPAGGRDEAGGGRGGP
ncbi:MAG TPA: prolipoprotein diacylglyceryl transferase [Actinomycetota bacterium]|nr:prolipoprotein diacylglyceryl transferase [Actinomycetota bacterium]